MERERERERERHGERERERERERAREVFANKLQSPASKQVPLAAPMNARVSGPPIVSIVIPFRRFLVWIRNI